jgi:DNA replication and repair protein RecF
MEKAFRQRNRLLEEERPDARWLAAIEREAAELAIAVTAARLETVSRLVQLIRERKEALAPFPWADVRLAGDLESALGHASATETESWYAAELERNRWRDRAAGRATIGPNASDLAVRHGPKDVPAGQASTGEQKSLLIGLFLAQAELVHAMSGIPPTLLLDEVAAHLDGTRRRALYAALARLKAQVWLTGTDAALFDGLDGEVLVVAGNRVSRGG